VPYVGFYATRPTRDTILMKLYHPKDGLDEGRWAPSHAEAGRCSSRRARRSTSRSARLYAQFQKVARDDGPFIIPFFRSELAAMGLRAGFPAEREQLRDGSRGSLAHRRRAAEKA